MTTTSTTITATQEQTAAVFAKWEQDWRDRPEDFMSADERLAETPEEYGAGQAVELIAILEGVG